MNVRVGALALCLVQLAQPVAGGRADAADCRWPVVNKIGFRPHTIVHYETAASPGGVGFPASYEPCVDRAFAAGTAANAATGLDVRFERGPAGIVVRIDRPGGLALFDAAGAGWADPVRDDDGYLERASIWVTSNTRLIDSCIGLTKVLLHELGHLHGLRDAPPHVGPTVMNRAAWRNDSGERIPLKPTACDARQARRASLAGTSRLSAAHHRSPRSAARGLRRLPMARPAADDSSA